MEWSLWGDKLGIELKFTTLQFEHCRHASICHCVHQALVYEHSGQHLEIELFDEDPDKDDFLGRWAPTLLSSHISTLVRLSFIYNWAENPTVSLHIATWTQQQDESICSCYQLERIRDVIPLAQGWSQWFCLKLLTLASNTRQPINSWTWCANESVWFLSFSVIPLCHYSQPHDRYDGAAQGTEGWRGKVIYKSVYTLHILRNNMYLLSWWELDEEIDINLSMCLWLWSERPVSRSIVKTNVITVTATTAWSQCSTSTSLFPMVFSLYWL